MRSGTVMGGEEESRGVVWRRIVSVILVVWLFGVAGKAVATVKRARNADRREGGCILVWLCLRLKSVKCGDFGLKERRMVEARIVHEKCGCKYYDRLRSFLG